MTAAERKVARAADKAALALQNRDDAIREAREVGVPLRALASAAQMSHESVRRICSHP